jgi:hypothetical protein
MMNNVGSGCWADAETETRRMLMMIRNVLIYSFLLRLCVFRFSSAPLREIYLAQLWFTQRRKASTEGAKKNRVQPRPLILTLATAGRVAPLRLRRGHCLWLISRAGSFINVTSRTPAPLVLDCIRVSLQFRPCINDCQFGQRSGLVGTEAGERNEFEMLGGQGSGKWDLLGRVR